MRVLNAAHGAVASKVIGKRQAGGACDLDTAPIDERLRATLRFLRKVTREHEAVTADEYGRCWRWRLAPAIEDALHVGFAFNVITRLADTFEFEVGSPASFDASAKALLTRGYK